MSGDGCGRCLHPDRADASVHEFHRLLGPDDNPQGHGWSIGKHTQELGVLGCLCAWEVRDLSCWARYISHVREYNMS